MTGIVIGLVSHTSGLFAILGFDGGKATGFFYDGFIGMIRTCLFCIALFGAMGVLDGSGVLDRTIQNICSSSFARTEKGAELLIAFDSFIATILLGGVTSASVLTFGPIADELGAKHNIHPYRRANILSGFANTFPAILSFISAFIFISTSVLQPLIKENSYLPNVTSISDI
ncbi:hypothetical protein [Pseudoramibacter faecis]|uniref:hypothetical protein n=1 Tax=Pseudoramibacter faecis TaxID=3108534 RepID=UPI002E79DACA|nr:hypothetical protein [Pseudoramibacter sp. HA2172]